MNLSEERMMTNFFNDLPKKEKEKVIALYLKAFEEINSAYMMMRFYLMMTLSLEEIEPILDDIKIRVIR